ncbi:MAG: lipopolysaccharide transport periplasmic protein LptA [Thermodesulfovibrionia bacterium]|nr:lipopolysaccharide transport periplasmic protein LptA [Thermodesulfovibrionia bacterium]
MSKALFTVNIFLAITLFFMPVVASHASTLKRDTPIVITSDTLTADNKNDTAIFEGSVVATSQDIKISSDKMTVYYRDGDSKIAKIHAVGNIKVQKDGMAIFSEEAEYIDEEEKIIFTGNPKVIENDNSITGTRIIYFLKDDRAVVEGSKVLIKNKK